MIPEETKLIRVCCEFLQLIYDPFLKWPFYTRTHQLATKTSSYHAEPQLHLEIVPFIYTCFEDLHGGGGGALKLGTIHELGANILSVLGAISIGSLRNARLVICPATINVIMKILGDWTLASGLRRTALDTVNLMLHMLIKSNPVERQIEVDIVVQEYLRAVQSLVKVDVVVVVGGGGGQAKDENSLISLVTNINLLLMETSTKQAICEAFVEGHLIMTLAELPKRVIDWPLDISTLASAVVEVIAAVSYSVVGSQVPEKALGKLFSGLREVLLVVADDDDGTSKRDIIRQCLSLATNPNDQLVVNTMVVSELISWLPILGGDEQELVIGSLQSVCAKNTNR